MPREFGPVLIRTSPVTAPGAGAGSSLALDFNFGTLTGARIYRVVYGGSSMAGAVSGGLDVGLNYNADAPVSVAMNDIFQNENVFAEMFIDASLTTSGLINIFSHNWDPPSTMPLFIARNVAFQQRAVAAANGVGVRIYFRFVTFTEAEIGGLIAFRR